MEKQQLTPETAFKVVYNAIGALQLNRADSQMLDAALRILAGLLPEETSESNEN